MVQFIAAAGKWLNRNWFLPMRKLTDEERQLLRLISLAGGSVCPGVDTSIPKAAHKALRKMVTRGDLTVEETDDGPRFTLTHQGQTEAEHG